THTPTSALTLHDALPIFSTSASTTSTRELLDRFEQFVEESEWIVPQVGDALRSGDLGRVGLLIDRSQELAERLLRNQVPETIARSEEHTSELQSPYDLVG